MAPRTAEQVRAEAAQHGVDDGLPAMTAGNPSSALIRANWRWFSMVGSPRDWRGGWQLVRLIPEPYGAERAEGLGWLGDAEGEAFAQARADWSDAHGNRPVRHSIYNALDQEIDARQQLASAEAQLAEQAERTRQLSPR